MEEVQGESKDTQAPSEGTETAEVTANQSQAAEDVVRRETHQRLLKESRSYKERAQKAESLLKDIEERALVEQNQYKELYERAKAESSSLASEKTALLRRVSLEPELVRAGCVDSVTALQLGNSELLVEDGSSLQGIQEFIEDLQKSKPYLFTSKTPSSINASVPSGGLKAEANTDPSKLSEADIKAEIKRINRQLRGA